MSKPEDTPQVDPLLGTTFARRYLIERRLGRGGMGVVYQATQIDLNRQVVLKLLAPDWIGDPEALARFEREARGLSSLQHPNIVTIHDFGRVDGRAFIVMEYVSGETLDRFVRRKQRLSLADFVPIAAQVLKGLGEAHSRGIIHRDIKPANIMLCERQGRANYVKILDFGLAKLVSGSSDITKQNVLGTPTCLSPEQILGEKIDQRVDVYAVGTLFYFMLAGVMPFVAENDTALLYKHVHEKPQPLAGHLPEDHGVPDGVLDLIGRCLEKSRDKRPRDANEVVEGLIDQVPFSMFRLPRAVPKSEEPAELVEEPKEQTGERSKPVPAAHEIQVGSFGRGTESSPGFTPPPTPASGQYPPAAPTLRPMTVPPTTIPPAMFPPGALADQLKAQGIPMDQSSVFQAQDGRTVVVVGANNPNEQRRNLIYGGAALLMVVLLVAYALSGRGDDEAQADPTAAPIAGSAGAEEISEEMLADQLAEAEDLVDSKKFSKAKLTLDTYEDDFKRYPGLALRAADLRQRLETSRLLANGQGFESSGDTLAALRIYRTVLETDGENADAKSRIKALVGDTSFGLIAFSTTGGVVAAINVDGKDIGQTPITHPLAPGKHTVTLSATGYKPFSETFIVTGGKDEPRPMTLEAKSSAPVNNGPPPTKTVKKPPQPSGGDAPKKPPPTKKPDEDSPLMSIPKRNK
jgi:eukaryotic-like serine/threonine-protein kinase